MGLAKAALQSSGAWGVVNVRFARLIQDFRRGCTRALGQSPALYRRPGVPINQGEKGRAEASGRSEFVDGLAFWTRWVGIGP